MKTYKTHTSVENNLVVSYLDELGKEASVAIPITDLTNYNALITEISAKINDTNFLPKVLNLVQSVSLTAGKFFITGENGYVKEALVSELSEEIEVVDGKTQKQVYDDLAAVVLAATGQAFTQLYAPFGTGNVILNNIKLDYVTVASQTGDVMANATKLALQILNAE